jgi:lipid-binding SYLF domain-containing protein
MLNIKASSKTEQRRYTRGLTTLLLAASSTVPLVGCSRSATPANVAQPQSSSQQAIVERSTMALEQMRKNPRFAGMEPYLQQARGVMIFPRLVKASLILGGEGGNGVLIARKADGSWSDPAFYSVGASSVGLQIGYQRVTVVLLIMDQPTLERALHSSFVLGAKAGATLGNVDDLDHTQGGVMSANIYQAVEAEGAFAGVSLDGYVISARSHHNRDYYGRTVSPREILIDGSAQNQSAQPMRALLTRTSSTHMSVSDGVEKN